MAESVPNAVQNCHELLLWLIPHLDKFPKVRRFTLGERLEQGLLEVLKALVEAAYSRDKRPALRRANMELQVVLLPGFAGWESRIVRPGMAENGAGRFAEGPVFIHLKFT